MTIRRIYCCLIFLFSLNIYAQNIIDSNDTTKKIINERYREDQFYIGLVYSMSINLPSNIFQNGLPYGIHIGFIRDIPINKACNRGVGIGFGYATNSNYSNLRASKDSSGKIYYSAIKEGINYSVNKIETHAFEVPLELRWRTSTYDSYSFWRIYLGVKASYVFYAKSKYASSTSNYSTFYNPDVNKWQYSIYLTFNFGGKWNIFSDYSLNNLMNTSAKIEGTNSTIKMRNFNLGIRFYIL